MSDLTYSVYFAGGLFDAKELVGNAMLAHYIEKVSDGRFTCVLAQNGAQTDTVEIRDRDLRFLVECDIGLYNFDGTDLDSGTVVEYTASKFFDIPCVLLRTDFRSAGEGTAHGDPWNLMASGYPRTEKLVLNGIALYQEAFRERLDRPSEALDVFYTDLAKRIIEKMDDAMKEDPNMRFSSKEEAAELFSKMLSFAGESLKKRLPEGWLEEVIDRKIERGLMSIGNPEEAE